MKEQTLSSKYENFQEDDYDGIGRMYKEEDVREAVKKLKEDLRIDRFKGMIDQKYVLMKIDEIFGEELSK